MKITWTNERTPPRVSPLLLAYQNKAIVQDESGEQAGVIYHLWNGYYRPSADGIRGEDEATPDTAARSVIRIRDKFRPKK